MNSDRPNDVPPLDPGAIQPGAPPANPPAPALPSTSFREGAPDARPELPAVPDLLVPQPLPRFAQFGEAAGGLSSLAQSARQKQIDTARTILLGVGGLMIIVTMILFAVRFSAAGGPMGGGVPRGERAAAQAAQRNLEALHDYLLLALAIFTGAAFIILGALVRRHPVVCTITGLVLFLAAALASSFLTRSFSSAMVFKVMITIALFRAVVAALAAEKEKRDAFARLGNEF